MQLKQGTLKVPGLILARARVHACTLLLGCDAGLGCPKKLAWPRNRHLVLLLSAVCMRVCASSLVDLLIYLMSHSR